jgi:hypothetical protein
MIERPKYIPYDTSDRIDDADRKNDMIDRNMIDRINICPYNTLADVYDNAREKYKAHCPM